MVDSDDGWTDKYSHRLSNPELRCRNQCGFYGNPIYQGYCSKCYKILVRDSAQESPSKDSGSDSRAKRTRTGEIASGGLSFGKFITKKKEFNTAKGRGKLFASPMKIRQSQAIIPPQKSKEKDNEMRQIDPFNEFMKTLKKPAAQDIVQHLKTFRRNIVDKSVVTVDEQTQAVQDFYESTSKRLETHPLFKSMSDEQREEMMDGIEKHLMTSIYNKVYSPASCDDEIQDLLLLRKIRHLSWLTQAHLGDIVLRLDVEVVQLAYTQARQELWNIESKKAPQDKLNCILRSCRQLLDCLKLSLERPASADDFVPSLIFLIIDSCPQHLHSNVNYISRFSNPSRLMTGEGGYYFTNFVCAVTFIENVSAESLNISQEEFNKHMGYTDGKTEADILIEECDTEEEYTHVQTMKSCCQAMKESTDRMQLMVVEANDICEQISSFRYGVRDQIKSIVSHTPPKSLYTRHSPGTVRHSTSYK